MISSYFPKICNPVPPVRRYARIENLIGEHVARTPHATAVETDKASWSYAELNAHTDAVAAKLLRLGVDREQLVGLCFDRSYEMIVAMLGVLKAGGAFLPLDPNYPQLRLSQMVADAKPPIVISQSRHAGLFSESDVEIVRMDAPPQEKAEVARIDDRGTGNQLAYAIFTSGSTGRPKAALLEHRGLCNLALSQARHFAIDSQSRVLQFASLSFDASISEIFVTLAAGAVLCIADRLRLTPGKPLRDTIERREISVVTLPPSILAMIEHDLPTVRTLVVAGEPCPADLASRWSVGRQLINAYGPTETTVCASVYHCPQGDQQRPPIGKPIDHFELLILDEQQRPTKVGEVGELYIAGVGVARGYLNRPRLTAERFVPFPHGPGRMYRTGDLVRQLPTGDLMFIGRQDHQIKIRGVRIELDEIATILEQHSEVGQAIVMAEAAADQPKIVAHVARRNGSPLSGPMLRTFLQQRLPAHMNPAKIIVHERLPLSPTGKVDGRALKEAEEPDRHDTISPRDRVEFELLDIWQSILQRNHFGVTDDFFELGGDSLGAMQLLCDIESRFGVAAPMSRLTVKPTIANLAELIRQRHVGDWSPLVPLRPVGSKPPFFMIHPGGGNALCYVALARRMDGNRPFYAIQAAGVDGHGDPVESVAEMAEHYIAAIRQVQPVGPYYLGGWSFGGIVAFETARQLKEQGEDVGRLVIVDAGIMYSFAVLLTLFTETKVPVFQLSELPEEEMIRYFRKPAEQAQLTPPGADEALIRRILRIFVANAEAAYRYRPSPFAGSAVFVKAEEPFVKVRVRRDPADEWAELCFGGIQSRTTSGNHLTMVHEPHVRQLARILDNCLDS